MALVLRGLAVAATLALLAGCSGSVAALDGRDRSDPLIRDAEIKVREGDIEGAVTLYREALDSNPRLARGHLDLAILLHDHDRDLVRAIYHYERYLDLRPDADKRKMIEGRMRLARQAFAAQQQSVRSGAGVPTVEARENAVRLLALRDENEALKAQIAALEQRAEKAENALREVRRRVERADATPGPEGTPARRHVVQGGDTLSAIAAKYYGDAGRWSEIRDANRAVLGGSSTLKVGQALVIP